MSGLEVLLLEDMRAVAEGREPSDAWQRGIRSTGARGDSDNFGAMSIGLATAARFNGAAKAGVNADLVPELEATQGRFFEDREFRSAIYHEWRTDGYLLALEFLPDSPQREAVRTYLRQSTILWAYMSVASTHQAPGEGSGGGRPSYTGPGGYPASLRAKPFRAAGEYAANYNFARICGLDPKDKRRRPRNIDLLKDNHNGKWRTLFDTVERSALRAIVEGAATRSDHEWALEQIETVRVFAPYRVLRGNGRVTTFWPRGVASQNTAALYFSECVVGQTPSTPWPFSQDRVRQGSVLWETEVVAANPYFSESTWQYKVEGPVGNPYVQPVARDPLLRLDLYPHKAPEMWVDGLRVGGDPQDPQIDPDTLPPQRETKGCFGWLSKIF